MFEPVVYWSGKRGRGRFYMESSGMEHAVMLLNVRKVELCARWAVLVLSDQFIRVTRNISRLGISAWPRKCHCTYHPQE